MTSQCSSPAIVSEEFFTDIGEDRQICMRLTKLRHQSPPRACALYLHGDGFSKILRDTALPPLVSKLASEGIAVFEADYRNGSSIQFPRSFDIAYAVLTYLIANRTKFGASSGGFYLIGLESGGGIAAGLAIKARDMKLCGLSGQVLISPLLDYPDQSATEADQRRCLQWNDGMTEYLNSFFAFRHPYAIPVACSRLSGIAPTVILNFEGHPLLDTNVKYVGELTAAGVEASMVTLPANVRCDIPDVAIKTADVITQEVMKFLGETA